MSAPALPTLANVLPPPHRTLPIRVALGLGLALLLLVIGGFTAWQVSDTGEVELRRREAQSLAEASHTLAGRLAVGLEERYADLSALRDLLDVDFGQAPTAQRRALLDRVLESHAHFDWLGLLDLDGRVQLASHGRQEGELLANLTGFDQARAGQDHLGLHQRHPAGRKPSATGPASAAGQGRAMRSQDSGSEAGFDITLPLHGQGRQVDGVLAGHVNHHFMEDMVSELVRAGGQPAAQRQLEISVVDAQGEVLFDTDSALSPTGLSLPSPGTMAEAVWTLPGGGELESYYVVAQLPATRTAIARHLDWRVIVRTPSERLHGALEHMRLRVLAICLAVGLVFGLAGNLLVKRVVGSLQSLVEDMGRFAITGEPTAARPPSRIAEVERLHGGLIAMTRHVAVQRQALNDAQRQMVQALARAGEYRDNDTGSHVLRMSLCAELLARLAGEDKASCEQIRLAAQLHDLGKIGIPDAVLLKRGRFDEAEREVVRRHPEIGAGILAGFDAPLLCLARAVSLTHHERWDGSGYPLGLAGESIPLAGRIVSLCDVFDALLSPRPYKAGWPLPQVLDWLAEQSGQHFDPRLTALLLTHVDQFLALRQEADGTTAANDDGSDPVRDGLRDITLDARAQAA